MRGHLRERSPGHWAIVIDVRDPTTGKRRRRWHSFTGTKREAQIEAARLISEQKNGTAVESSRLTLAAFFERWIEHMQGQVSPRSHERYAELCRKNLAPLLGGLTLTKLQPAHISAAYAKALTSGRRDGSGGLSARTVVHMHRVLREALQQAVRWQMLPRNPADACKPPRVERKPMQTYDLAQTAELLAAIRGSRFFIPVVCHAGRLPHPSALSSNTATLLPEKLQPALINGVPDRLVAKPYATRSAARQRPRPVAENFCGEVSFEPPSRFTSLDHLVGESSGQAAAPARSVMTSRRFTRSPRRRLLEALCGRGEAGDERISGRPPLAVRVRSPMARRI
jgi:Phage integrase, N-terminal SAM-like domain